MHAVKVKKTEAQKTLNRLKAEGRYDSSREIMKEGDFVWIPVKGRLPGSVEKQLKAKERTPSLGSAYGIHSFDIVGDISIVFIPDKQRAFKQAIGRHIMKLHPHIKAVYMEVAAASGDFRLQELELIAGRGSETVHKENGLKFKLDVTKVFFSPRQLTERMKLTEFVDDGDEVCVFFSGIAPIPIYLSRFSKPKKIVGIELNPDSHRYATENVRLNRAWNVELINGDVRKVVPRLAEGRRFDLVVLPLPKGALPFLETAGQALKKGGRAIVYVASSPDSLESKLDIFRGQGFEVETVRKELQISPKEWRYAVHARKAR